MDRTQGWLLDHAAELPLSSAVLNLGFAGLIALAAIVAWQAVLRRLLLQAGL